MQCISPTILSQSVAAQSHAPAFGSVQMKGPNSPCEMALTPSANASTFKQTFLVPSPSSPASISMLVLGQP